jgi:hypothetical protein
MSNDNEALIEALNGIQAELKRLNQTLTAMAGQRPERTERPERPARSFDGPPRGGRGGSYVRTERPRSSEDGEFSEGDAPRRPSRSFGAKKPGPRAGGKLPPKKKGNTGYPKKAR